MLVLSRMENESILIFVGKDIVEISLNDISGNRAKIGIQCPHEYRILRKELFNVEKPPGKPSESGQEDDQTKIETKGKVPPLAAFKHRKNK